MTDSVYIIEILNEDGWCLIHHAFASREVARSFIAENPDLFPDATRVLRYGFMEEVK